MPPRPPRPPFRDLLLPQERERYDRLDLDHADWHSVGLDDVPDTPLGKVLVVQAYIGSDDSNPGAREVFTCTPEVQGHFDDYEERCAARRRRKSKAGG